MTDEELKDIEAQAGRGLAPILGALVSEVRRLRGLIESARGADFGWCVFCDQHKLEGGANPDRHLSTCPAFTESGEVR